MTTIKEGLTLACKHLCEAGVDESARLDAEILLSLALNKSRSYLFAHAEDPIDSLVLQRFNELMDRRLSGEPIAYIQGFQEFWSLNLYVSPAVLIPRSDTELLVELVLERYPSSHSNALQLIDAGTGSGAISIALASERPAWRIMALDYSANGLGIAQKNIHQHGLSESIQLCRSSWCSSLASEVIDVLVSNPPYIDGEDVHLTQGDVRFEPSSALVAHDHGLADIQTLLIQGLRVLKPEGSLFIEHGWQQAASVREMMRQCGYVNCMSVKDLAGNERVSCATKA